jgi:hypothetical protein
MAKLLIEVKKGDPHYKLYMRYTKKQLLVLASERNLDTSGNKEDLVLRCAQEHINRSMRDYAIISGGH